MNLVVDLGNTSYKFAFFKGERCLVFGSFKKGNTREIKKFIGKQKKIDAVIVSSVVGSHSIKPLLKGIKNQFLFASQTNIPIKNLYKTPETLGRDRLAAAVGGYKKFPQKNVLVIDAGTCIKYDLVNSKGEYLGGGISPGL